jgi:SAM-dependent methyltransferase
VGSLAGAVSCPGCGRGFAADGGVWDLRPRDLDARKDQEDRVHVEAGLPTWRRLLFHKRFWLEWCETRWLPELLASRPTSFLEIGGGLCYASALAKERAPAACVVATDISPRYLRRHALQTGAIIGTPADVYAAADAEALPFEDGEFQAIFSQVVLYRLPDPARALREIRRVLAPGGRYLGIERASPWAPPFAEREARTLGARARTQGTGERPRSYREWAALLTDAGWSPGALAPVPGRRVRARWLRRLGNAARPIYVALRLAR